jgi:hypothetical protein
MFAISKNFLTFQDRLFLIKKVIKEEHRPIVDAWKLLTNSDTVLKKEGLLYFLESIPEAEIVE